MRLKYGYSVAMVSSTASTTNPMSTSTNLKNSRNIEENAINAAQPHRISTAPCTVWPMRSMR